MIAPSFVAHVASTGKLVFDQPVDAMRHLRSLAGKKVVCTFTPWRASRSDAQRRYWWAVVVAVLADHCGYTPDQMHDALKYQFLREESDGPLVKIRGTKDLSRGEMADLIDRVRLWAETELDVYIPAPNEVVVLHG